MQGKNANITITAHAELVQEGLRRILASDPFKQSSGLSKLLTHIVQRSLEGRESELKELVLGAEVLRRGPEFNPKTDPIVRVQVARIRKKLDAYYAAGSNHCQLIIEIPKGAYMASFRTLSATEPESGLPRRLYWPKKPAKLLGLTIAVLITAAVGTYFLRRRPWPASLAVPSVAVIYFTDLSQRQDQQYLSDGISELLIESVSHLHGVRVISAKSSSEFRGDHLDIKAAAQRLRVNYVLTGSVQSEGRRIRVGAHLIKAEDGSYLWSNIYTSSLENVFGLEDMVTGAIAEALEVQIVNSGGTKKTHRAGDAHAYESYLRGRFHWNERSEKGLREAASDFEQALQIDPSLAEAYAGLADVNSELGEYGFAPLDQSISRSKDFANRALQLDSSLPEAHAALGMITSVYEWKWAEAEMHFRRALEENPNYAPAYHWYGTMLYTLGRNDAAVEELSRGLASDPLSVPINTTLGWAYYNARRPDLALKQAAKALDLNPKYVPAIALRVYARLLQHDLPKALDSCRQIEKLVGRGPRSLWYYGLTWGASGKRDKAEAAASELISMKSQAEFRPIYVATIFASLGDKDSAIQWLNESLTQHDPYLAFLRSDPLSDSLRSDPRFSKILSQLNM